MTPQEFCYWLQGYFEVSGNETLTPEQVKMVKEHLQLVFRKETISVVVKTPEPDKPNKNGDIFTKDGLQEAYRKWAEQAKGQTIITCKEDEKVFSPRDKNYDLPDLSKKIC